MRRTYLYGLPLLLAVATFTAMQTYCKAPAQTIEKHGLRIATYNISWMNETMSEGRKQNLKSVLANLNSDVVAVQEVQSRKAMEQVFGHEWEIGILDETSEVQEVALAVRKPLKIVGEPVSVFGDIFLDFAFPGKRDVLRTIVETPSGFQLTFYVVHMKSRGGEGGRRGTDSRRIMAAGLLAAYIRAQPDQNSIVLGDFNDTPSDVSVRILQTGDLLAKPGKSNGDGPLLFNITAALYEKDYVSFGMNEVYRGIPVTPIIRGAREENERLRGRDYRYPDDLAITQALFDQILVSKSLAQIVSSGPQIYCGRDALVGNAMEVDREPSGYVAYRRQGTLASDHLPVYADFRIDLPRSK